MEKVVNQHVYSGTSWEKQVAYSRARRVGDLIWVAGTTAVDDAGKVVGPGDMATQTRFVFRKIERALQQCGASLRDVVRTRMFVTRMSEFPAVASAHHEMFEGVDPVATCVEIAGLVNPELHIEVEVDAIVQSRS
jgi:enamine deaminase RidA (YjgF/YER057c/UK114 family)